MLGSIYYDSYYVLKINEIKAWALLVHTGWQCHLHIDGCTACGTKAPEGMPAVLPVTAVRQFVHHLVHPTLLCMCSRISALVLEVIGFRSLQLLWSQERHSLKLENWLLCLDSHPGPSSPWTPASTLLHIH